MRRVLFEAEGQRVPVWVWARDPSEEALRQLQQIASRPYVVSHVAAMPDVHMAEGVAVGTVFAMERERTLVPAALGGDLGCGVAAVRLSCPAAAFDRRDFEHVLERMASAIPVGDRIHRGKRAVDDPLLAAPLSTRALERVRERLAGAHWGTLGGGNHFLELDRDPEGQLWLLVHSGSRGLGAAIADHHRRAAVGSGADALAGIDADSEVGAAYVKDAGWAIAFARANRQTILHRAREALNEAVGDAIEGEQVVDVHHNFFSREEHDGRLLWVHRKGALGLSDGELGIIPGSMGTATYLVRGLGGRAAFNSCSHCAGRIMSRSRARRTIRPSTLAASMRRVVYRAPDLHALVEEAPAVYRDVRDVLEDEDDLVTPVLRLEPLAVLKG